MKISHSPRLDTILMVEKAISKNKVPITVANLKRELPKQVNHNTLMVILEYLEQSNKISAGLRGISWSFQKK